jgi:cell wall-associated NlpC family hydrolase
MMAGCASSPAPQTPAASEHWQGSGGAASPRERGEELAEFALGLRGLPYRYGGATRDGFDCSGLVFYAHRQLGLVVPRTSREQAGAAREIKQSKLRRGDLVFFKIGSRLVNHVGIYIGDRRFVHAPGAGKPVTINSLDDEYYAQRYSSAGRYWDR